MYPKRPTRALFLSLSPLSSAIPGWTETRLFAYLLATALMLKNRVQRLCYGVSAHHVTHHAISDPAAAEAKPQYAIPAVGFAVGQERG